MASKATAASSGARPNVSRASGAPAKKSTSLKGKKPVKDEASAPQSDAPSAPGPSEEQPLELIFGIVAPTGIDVGLACGLLEAELRSMDYESQIISLSRLIELKLGYKKPFKNEHDRISKLMDMGTFLKKENSQADIVARFGIQAIQAVRRKQSSTQRLGRAYIIRSFKRKEEVELFREIYGDQFVLISAYAPKPARIEYLKRRIGPTLKIGDSPVDELARALIERDYSEDNVINGQQVGKTFPLADYFVNTESRPDLEANIRRVVHLTFGDPYISPSQEEQGMFFAQAAGLRSLDLSRQVGAAILTAEGDIQTTGCNEVPSAGGGLYWASQTNVKRDLELGYDSNVILKRHVLEDTIVRMKGAGWLGPEVADVAVSDLLDRALLNDGSFMESSTFNDVIEYGRAVHAEMAAISDAAKRGIGVRNSSLFCTTFPCHLCARHIVAAGLKEVFFIEPYEKSRVKDLYPDSIAIEPSASCPDRVAFKSFVGVAPRRYIDFFQSRGSKKNKDGSVLDFKQAGKYKKFKKKVFHISLLEKVAVEETADFIPWPHNGED